MCQENKPRYPHWKLIYAVDCIVHVLNKPGGALRTFKLGMSSI